MSKAYLTEDSHRINTTYVVDTGKKDDNGGTFFISTNNKELAEWLIKVINAYHHDPRQNT